MTLPQIVIVAGGLGSRLAEVGPAVPKALMPINGTPFITYVLEMLVSRGAHRIHLCLGHQAEQVEAYLETRASEELKITTSVEPTPLGTAGALRYAVDQLEDRFILLLGDTYTPVDLEDLTREHERSGSEAAMVVLENHDRLVPSNVDVAAGRVVRYEKSAGDGQLIFVDYGIAMLRRSHVLALPAGQPVDLATLFHQLIDAGELAALPVQQRFYEIGSPDGHAEFVRLAAARRLLDAGAGNGVKVTIATRDVHSTPWLDIREDIIRQADGTTAKFTVVSRADFVVIVCQLDDGSLVSTEQFRYATGRFSCELPQGARETGESAVAAAFRELREETGWIGEDAVILAAGLHEASDWATQSFTVVAMRATVRGSPALEASESGLTVSSVHPRDVAKLVTAGAISDAATLAALWLWTSRPDTKDLST